MSIRNYINSAPAIVLTVGVDDVATTLTVASTTGFPTVPFLMTLARQTVDEEVVLCTGIAATTFTVTRGYDGTSGVAHAIGHLVEHTSSALDYREAGIVRVDETERDALGGVDDWEGRAVFNTDTKSLEISDGAGAWTPIMPPGAIIPYGGASSPVGWFLCDGTAVSRTTYAALFAVLGTAYGVGDGSTTFNIPDLRQRFPLGKAVSGTGVALGDTGGAIDHTHTGPSHTHTGPSHTHAGPNHTHTMGTHVHAGPSHSHSGPSHTHTMGTHNHTSASHNHSMNSTGSDNHTHSFSDSFVTATAYTTGLLTSGGAVGFIGAHTHSGSVSGTTGSDNHSHTNSSTNAIVPSPVGSTDPGDTNAGGTAVTGLSGTGNTGATDPGNTNAGGTGATGAEGTGATGASGTAATGLANAPFATVNYIVKV